MKFLCIGDPHIKVNNIDLIDQAETQILAHLKNELGGLTAIVIEGDQLQDHERLHTLPMNRAHRFFSELSAFGVPVYILVGNHDYIQNDQFLTDNHWMSGLKKWPNITVVDRVERLAIEDEFVLFCPYVPNGRFVEALETRVDCNWKKAMCIFAHQEFEGAKMRNGMVSIHGDKWASDYPPVISGHIHGKQSLASGVHYTGALLPSARESNSSITIATCAREQLKLESLPLLFPKKNYVYPGSIKNLVEMWEKLDKENIDCIVLEDHHDKFKSFKGSSVYTEILARGFRLNFKPILTRAEIPEAGTDAVGCELFHQLLAKNVLEREDEYLYCALEAVVNHRDLDEEEILVVPTIGCE